jgi:DNA polymerase
MSEISKLENEFKKVKNEVLNCKKCPLYKTRTHPVIGEGSLQAKIMMVGEAPGYNEDKEGRPFCGAAGKILDELLESISIKRGDIFIANILKCRPPGNRNPQADEIKACTPYLERQIEVIKPEAICALGNYSTAFIMEKYGIAGQIQGISKIHGKIFQSKTLFESIKIIPLYHPAVATYNINMKKILKKDFQILKTFK